MYKRYFIFALMCLLPFAAGTQNLTAQSQLAQDAYAIFEASCLNCHGPDGAFRETLLMEHSELIGGGTVVPGNPNASELYKRLLGPTENGAQMPFNLPQLPVQSIEVVRRWILAGAPDWTIAPTTLRRFITPREVLTSIESHLNSLSSFDRPFARYFTMTHLYNAGETPEILAEYRKALSKLINSLSWRLKITNPQPIDPQETIFYIDLRHYEWDRTDGWTKIKEEYPYHISFDAPEHLATRNQLGRLQTSTKTDVPSVHVDWFIAKASAPPLYDDLLSLPSSVQELETRLEVDVARNLRDAPGIEVWRAGLKNSGVSNHNRVVERHTSRYGAYWKSYDFAGSVGTRDIIVHPFNFTHDGGEIIFNLPNGLQGYYLVDSNGIQLDEAPISIVSNPAASDPTVRNGISCIGCHTEGMKAFEDEVRSAIEGNSNPPYDKAHVLRLYVEKSVMDALVEEDMNRYRDALEATGGEIGGVEPISRFHEAFYGPIGAAYAAAVVGLPTETLLEKVRENTGLQNVGLLALDNTNGSVKRDTWTSSFQGIIQALDYPQQIGDIPVDTQPDIIPGRPVNVPDPNLKALLLETLDTRRITADDMAQLKILRGKDKNISDLTGLEYAANLEELWISKSELSDLSPISRCLKLKRMGIWDTDVRDISPVSDLVNLEQLEFRAFITDISPVVKLTKLKKLLFYGGDIIDTSSIANMTELTHLRFRHNGVKDISVIARFVKLEWLDLHHNKITDVSALENLTKLKLLKISSNPVSSGLLSLKGLVNLEELNIHGSQTTDLSPLKGLVNLRVLDASSNNISDITALAGLNKLRQLSVRGNNILDFSPIAHMRKQLERFVWHENPGYPTEGKMIEGPWLWMFVPNETLDGSFIRDRDYLAIASDGRTTEIKIATTGATEGVSIGDHTWTRHNIPMTEDNNIKQMLGNMQLHGIVYGNTLLYSAVEQTTHIQVKTAQRVKAWLNGELVYQRDGPSDSTVKMAPATLKIGRNVLLVAVDQRRSEQSFGHFGFTSDAVYFVINPTVNYVFSRTPAVGGTFAFEVLAENILDLAGWQFDIGFDSSLLQTIDVTEGDFLKSDSGTTFFQGGRINNATGEITGLVAGRISEGGVSGSGSLVKVVFKAKSEGRTGLTLQNLVLGSASRDPIPVDPPEISITVEEQRLIGDANRDGVVNILDLITVAQQFGKRLPPNSPADINNDGIVNIFDLTLVAQGIGAAAPAVATDRVSAPMIEAWIAEARLVDDGSAVFQQGIANLQNLLTTLIIPDETALHANYPNPFNPETWIPYQLAAPAEITLTIYDMNGGVVRRLEMGHQAAGIYQSRSRALYWDGRNGRGESVASGLYFYTLRAGDFTGTRKMLIRK